ncbi:MAG TPA: hypothetical protein VFV34_05595, partial [Blastocatellia bacterium]|nr:hypothetical protein [Blastocatellia bacterium]
SVVSIIVAMNWGFNQALALGGATYLCALMLVGPLTRSREIVVPQVRETDALTEQPAEAAVEG